jgi:hypothetical protein
MGSCRCACMHPAASSAEAWQWHVNVFESLLTPFAALPLRDERDAFDTSLFHLSYGIAAL